MQNENQTPRQASAFVPAPIPDGRKVVDGNTYMTDGKGSLTPIEMIRAQDLLQDEIVRKIMGYMVAASEQITRLKAHSFDDIGDFEALLAQEYGATVGGAKGNKSLMTVDQLFKIEINVQDRVAFGPELTIAKSLVDECLREWSADANPELRAIVANAFQTDKAGQINRSHIYMLLRLEIADDRWQRAMQAIRDAMLVVGSKTYMRAYRRDSFDADWQAVTVDMAKA